MVVTGPTWLLIVSSSPRLAKRLDTHNFLTQPDQLTQWSHNDCVDYGSVKLLA